MSDNADISVKPEELRHWANACDAAEDAVKTQLAPGSGACTALADTADGWGFVNSIPEMRSRWEALNELIRDRLDDASDAFDDCADDYDDNESWLEELFGW